MCGIAGSVAFSGISNHDAAVNHVKSILKALAHRGPDESEIVADHCAVLGAVRLAIRGLNDGVQPMSNRDSGVVVICNGEIDNHHELRDWLAQRGRVVEQATDIAVIPGLYLELGDAFIERLMGVFAIAIWDPRYKKLILARDRAGERSLFFSIENGEVNFASEIAALTVNNRSSLDVSKTAVKGYLQRGFFTAPTTPYNKIQKVMPAEVVTMDISGVHRKCYWHWNIATMPKRPASLDAFDKIFREAVQRQSEVEVDYGLFLSGGIDSSLVAAVARSVRPEKRPKSYTVRFNETSFDEGNSAEQVAQTLGVESIPVWVQPTDFPDTIAELIKLTGEPLADPAWVPTALLARRAAQDVRVVLVGEGADELFAGYPTYIGVQLGERYARLPSFLRSAIRHTVELWPLTEKNMTVSYLLKRFVQGEQLHGLARHLLWTANISPTLIKRLGMAPGEMPAAGSAQQSLLDIVQRNDLETSLAEGLLAKADRAGMCSALEVRAPFLDKAVMEFAAGLPVRERVNGLATKVFLKRYALRYLPASIVHRRKRGLSVPLASWLRGPLYEWAQSRLHSDLLDDVGVSSRVALELLEEHRQQRTDHARALWTLIVLSEWLAWASSRVTDGVQKSEPSDIKASDNLGLWKRTQKNHAAEN